MKNNIKKLLSAVLSLTLLAQIIAIPAGAVSETDNISFVNDYVIFANELKINEYKSDIEGSVYAENDIEYTGSTNCIVKGTLNSSDKKYDNISANDIISVSEKMPDYRAQLNDEVFYKKIYDTDTLICNTEYDLRKSISVNGNLFLDQVSLKDKGYIKATDNIKFNAVNDGINDYSVFMYAEEGNIFLQGTNLVINGILYAPNGKIELNAKNLIVNGIVIADKIEFNGSELSVNETNDSNYPSFRPDIEIKISGEQKENRQVSFDISDSEDFDRIIKEKTEWSITDENGLSDNVFIDSDSSSEFAKKAVFKQLGDYLARVTVFTDNKSYTYEQKFSITEDISPIANILSEDVFYRTTDNNEAVITATDISYSSDLDDIGSRTWSIIFDSNNDGEFDDEEVFVNDQNEKEFKYKTEHVGSYKIKLKVQEHFENTIEKFISSEDYLTSECEKIITVDNSAPTTDLKLSKAKNLDLVFTVGSADTEKINLYGQKIEEIKRDLEEKGYNVNLSTVEASSISAQDSFAWTEYDHINYSDSYVPNMKKHILYEGNNIVMKGYGWAPLKDFLFIEDNNPSQKTFSFDIQRDNNDWHTMEGGGFLFNSSIDNGYLTGYCILLTKEGLKLIYLKGLNVDNLRNGSPNLLQNGGKVLENRNIGNVLDNHSLKIMVDAKSISVWDDDKVIIDNYILNDDITGYGYGPITSHTSHACSQQSYFTFGNIKMETVNGDSMSDILNNYKWTAKRNRYVINLSDTEVQDLKTDLLTAETAKAILEKNISFIGLGNLKSIAQYDKLLQSVSGVNIDNTDAEIAAEKIENYILSDMQSGDYNIGDYITTMDKLDYNDNYSDDENDPKIDQIYQYQYDSTIFESGSGFDIQQIESDTPLISFENAGAYNISVKVQDAPTEDDKFEDYRRWSDTDTYEKQIFVHTIPVASIDANVYLNSKDTKQAVVKISENSFDPDHISEENKGITDKRYSWKKISDTDWTDGMIPETVSSEEIYLLRLIVCDSEGEWSLPCVCVISVEKVNPEFSDTEKPNIILELSSSQINYGDKQTINVSVTDNICVASTEIYVDDNLIGNSQGTCVIDSGSEGEHTVKICAEDIFGNKAESEQKYIVIDNRDKTAPQIIVTLPNDETIASCELDIIGSVYDENELDYYKVEYALEGEPLVTAAYSREPVNNNTLATLNIEVKKGNVYIIKISAADKSGNVTIKDFTYTIYNDATPPEEKDIIPPTISLSSDKLTAEVGEAVTVNIETSDNKGISSVEVYKDGELVMSGPGTITFSNLETGIVTFRVIAEDINGNINQKEITVTIYDNSDKENPVVTITSPMENAILSDNAVFMGSVEDNDIITHYSLMYRKQGDDKFSVFAEGSSNRTDDILGTLDTSDLENGIYTIRLCAEDASGNETNYDVTVEIKNEKEILPDYERPYIKLNGNYKDGALVALNSDIEISAEATDNQKVKSINVYLNGEEIIPKDGKYSFNTDEAGFYQVSATAIDESGNEGWCKYTIQSVDTTKDSSVQCEITSPKASGVDIDESDQITDGRAIINDITEIKGTASSDELVRYELAYAPVDTENYTVFAEGKGSVTNDTLGTFDPSTLENGTYTIRLKVYTESLKYGEYKIPVQVEGKNKIGNYSFSFNDITLPVYTLPFAVSRTYNSMSRDNSGDFGFGWKMDISNIKVDISHSFSSGWNVVNSGGFMSSYSLKDPVGHTVTITYPDQSTEEFYLSLYPKTQSFEPIRYISSYKMIGNGETESTLEILDKYDTLMFDGGYNLFDTTAKMFEPKNFKLTTKQGIVYIINADTGVKSITDKQGNVLTFDSSGITHSDGKSIVFERDDDNRITCITDPEGKSVKYEYDSYGDLIAVTDRNGNTVRYIYGREHELIDIIDPNGTKATRNDYDDDGRLISSTDANGSIITYSYDIANRFETIVDELGNQTVYGYDKNGNIVSVTDCDGNVISFEYDDKGNKLKETDKQGNSVTYTYDDNGNITSITDALGNSRKMKYSSTNQLTELLSGSDSLLKYTYDKYDYVSTVTDELGNVEKFEYDNRGALTKLSDSIGTIQTINYDDKGNIISSSGTSGAVESYSNDENGICLSKTITYSDGTTKTEFYSYDNNGNLIGVKDNLGNYSYGVYDACGQLVSSTDRLGNTINYEYDLLGNTTKITYPDHTTEKFTYDIVGNMLTSEDRAGNKTEYSYDKFGNLVTEKLANGAEIKHEYDLSGNVTSITATDGGETKYEYDSLYRNTAIVDALGNRTEYEYDSNSNVISMTDPKGNTYNFEYDLADNCTKVIYPDGTSTSSEYDVRGRLTADVDQIGARTEYSYDNSNNLTEVKDALGNKTTYTYSDEGDLLSVTDANGNTTYYQYDTQGRLIKTTLPNQNTASMTYDKEGKVITSTDANGIITLYEYDNMGNVTKQTVGNDITSYTYTANGLIESVTHGKDCTKYSYNNLNQLVKKDLQDGTEINYTYDVSGNLTNISTPYSSTSYDYDKLGRIVRVVDHGGKATLYEYDENGNRSAVRYANGVVATYTYDSLNRLIKEKIVDKNGNNIAVYAYTLDKKGNRVKAVQDGSTIEYVYDKLNRLTKETTNQAVTSYTYDNVGNRLTKTVDDAKTEYFYNSYNQLTKEVSDGKTTTYTYDNNGNLLKQTNGTDVSEYSYDDYDRLISARITKGGKTDTESYTYDCEGNRLTKTTNGKLTKYIVDSNGLSQVLAELDSNDKVIAEYTHGIEIVSQTRNNITLYYLFDGNGNVRMLTDCEGTVSDTYDYDAFGVSTASTGLTVNPYQYRGEYQDNATGLYYLRARYYDSESGRFISADSYSGTISDPVSLHKYLYANANPVMNSDPTGYFSLVEVTAAMSINNTLEESYNNAILSGFINFMDAYLGGERDPYRLLSIFGNGFCNSLLTGAGMGFMSMVGNMACSMPVAAMTAKVSLGIIAGVNYVGSVQGMCQSFAEGKFAQGLFRTGQTVSSGYSCYKSWGSAFNTAMSISNGTACFVAGTKVLTEDGEKPIEEIEVGDYVYSTDPETGESEYKEVLQTFVNETSELVHIHANDDEIVSTPTHPFYSPVRGWTSAVNLRAGDILVLSNGEYVVVEQVQHEILEAPVKVYNFEVQDFHTYYVGKNLVLVHNDCEIKTWNEFQKKNKGKTSSENSKGWAEYKKNNFPNSGEHYLKRPHIRKSTLDIINDNTFRCKYGIFDEIGKKFVFYNKKVDLGHVPGHEFWYERNIAEAKGWTQSQFNDYMNNPEFYAWQDSHDNRSHLLESKH